MHENFSSFLFPQVRASSGSSSNVQYRFASGNEDGIFKIDSTSGVIGVAQPAKLDYETKPRLRLIVIAQADGGAGNNNNYIYGYATIWVNLRDINDHAPVFSQDKYSSATWEGVQPGRYVVQVWIKRVVLTTYPLLPSFYLNSPVSYVAPSSLSHCLCSLVMNFGSIS